MSRSNTFSMLKRKKNKARREAVAAEEKLRKEQED
jgi:hypothetical protein